MTPVRRIMDVVLASLLLLLLWPLLMGLALAILVLDGRPILYISERMQAPDRPFMLWKFRTMATAATDAGVSGGDKAHRVTMMGGVLRRYRLDELPQLLNILRGDIGFVGPRPPLRRYVERFPDLYGRVLLDRPGVTGLATLVFHRTEERLLAACSTPEETETVYERRCIPVKARLDLIYAQHRTPCLDLRMMVATVFRRIPPVARARK